jgi:hypothetical protein
VGAFQDEGPVWRTPTDGGPAVQVADRASRYFARVGTQLVTVVAIDADYLGTLLHVDLETGAERVVDERVFATSSLSGWRTVTALTPSGSPKGCTTSWRCRSEPLRELRRSSAWSS